MRRLCLFVVLSLVPSAALAQRPVVWSVERDAADRSAPLKAGESFTVVAKAEIELGWHLYALAQPKGGPIATTIAVRAGGPFLPGGPIGAENAKESFDPNFNMVTPFYEDHTVFRVPVRLAADAADGRHELTIAVRYQSCNDTQCIPPRTDLLTLPVVIGAGNFAPVAGSGVPAESAPAAKTSASASSTRAPVPDLAAADAATTFGAYVALAAVMGGLSLLTPCVFPMVPITVSYFTRRAERSRRDSIMQALVYGLGIVLTFTALGFALALTFGASGLNRFAANPWLNIGIAALFLVFALSLFGVYEIALPSRFVTAASKASSRGGYGGTLLMGLAFTLTSFTCTAPFLGTLLVVAAQGDWQWPMAGMLAFSTVFAIPFVVLALSPRLLMALPRSGAWMMSVKAMMGLLEVAAAMKFISNVDLVWGWGIFTRSVVLIIWIVVAVLMALYLGGLMPLGRAPKLGQPGIARMAASAAAVLLGVWLGLGVAGRRLGELEAFLPPASDASLAKGGELPWLVNDFQKALADAGSSGRRVLVDFTGYTCTNCRWMEANMFPREDVEREMSRYVRARLYTDGQGEPYEGFQQFQEKTFGTVALPLYAIFEPSGEPIVIFSGLTRDPEKFIRFLKY